MFNLEPSITEWRRQMLAAGIKTPVPLEELESHLRDEIERQMKSGLDEADAFQTAVQKIGQPRMVQNEFKKVEEQRKALHSKLLKTLAVVLTSSTALGLACMALLNNCEKSFFLGEPVSAMGLGSMALLKYTFVARCMVGMVVGFELPVILLALVKSGVLNHEKMVSLRRYVIVWNLILGALFTSPEVLTQAILAVVLQALYEISAWIAWYWERQEKKTQRS
jgi:hypothetical protein